MCYCWWMQPPKTIKSWLSYSPSKDYTYCYPSNHAEGHIWSTCRINSATLCKNIEDRCGAKALELTMDGDWDGDALGLDLVLILLPSFFLFSFPSSSLSLSLSSSCLFFPFRESERVGNERVSESVCEMELVLKGFYLCWQHGPTKREWRTVCQFSDFEKLI
jgi:hypothetical protein